MKGCTTPLLFFQKAVSSMPVADHTTTLELVFELSAKFPFPTIRIADAVAHANRPIAALLRHLFEMVDILERSHVTLCARCCMNGPSHAPFVILSCSSLVHCSQIRFAVREIGRLLPERRSDVGDNICCHLYFRCKCRDYWTCSSSPLRFPCCPQVVCLELQVLYSEVSVKDIPSSKLQVFAQVDEVFDAHQSSELS